MNSYNEFPDDGSDKEIFVQATGHDNVLPRHVSLHWKNGVTPQNELVTQLIHLTGHFAYYLPLVMPRSASSFDNRFIFSLGTYSRAQRDAILQLAADVPFGPVSAKNDHCVWMKGLLESMVKAGLLDKGTLAHLDKMVPLRQRVPEEFSPAPPVGRFVMSLDNEFPDDDGDKEIFLQADSRLERDPTQATHVLLFWKNGVTATKELATQLVQLTPNFTYSSPIAKPRSEATFSQNFHLSLGTFTRAQRDVILRLAGDVQFVKTSVRNDCRIWMRDLLESMITEGVLDPGRLVHLEKMVTLPQRVAEDE